MKFRQFASIVVPIILVTWSTPSRADLFTVSFAGTTDSVDPALGGAFSAGQTLTGTYTFESTTAARAGSDSTSAAFDALTNLTFTLGSYTATSTGAPEIQVDNDPPLPDHDRYAVVSRASDGLTGASVAGLALDTFLFRLDDSTNTVFSDALVLPTNLNLSSFDNSRFFIFFTDGTSPSIISGTFTSLSSVPEPSSMIMVGVGALGLAGYRLRRRAARV
jgi:PEP-CTERM motif